MKQKTDIPAETKKWRMVMWASVAGLIITISIYYLMFKAKLNAIEDANGVDEIMSFVYKRDLIFNIPSWVLFLCLGFVILLSLSRRKLKRLKAE